VRPAIERKLGDRESREELRADCSRPSQDEAARTCHRWGGSSHETCQDSAHTASAARKGRLDSEPQ
jgi:hypothetical protein